ncbi:MAG: hypothetical protein P8Y81_10770 [Ignavibacteriaceae bacterium]|jgi:uncharacterized protein YqfB (UPF0267 family)
MNILLDLLGSTIIGGLLISMLINFNIFQSNTSFASDSELQLQQNAKTLAEILNYDLRKIGYGYDSTAVTVADSEKITFYSDIDKNGAVDQITYTISDTSDAYFTTNPEDVILYRIVNNDTSKGPSLGLTKLKFSYLDGMGAETSTLSDIKYIHAELWIKSIEPVQDEYIFTYWEMTINPRNL